ncbi:MAG: hypothetical protein JWN04_523 [Myxococcaceae bacterium]|nr:hypothetical protein [Myxococcaceae bacterium]
MAKQWSIPLALYATLLAHCSADGDSLGARTNPASTPDVRDAASATLHPPDLDAGGSSMMLDAATLASSLTEAGWSGPFGPPPPVNPAMAADGLGTQHGDSAASDTSPLPGPGRGEIAVRVLDLFAACPSVLVAPDGMVFAVCTQIVNQTPAVYLLHPETGDTLAMRALAKGSLFGGVYPYLDVEGRLLVVDGEQNLLRIEHTRSGAGVWQLDVESTHSLGAAGEGCSGSACNGVVGLLPGYDGRVWFATQSGQVGVFDAQADRVEKLSLPDGERIYNSLATAPEGTAVVTDHALYLLGVDARGKPVVLGRAAYERGSARKPGQLSQGSGSTPTFFGPRSGSDYLTITDNAEPTANLLVFASRDLTHPLCQIALPAPTGYGSENSPIGSGRSVFVASTYGYPYAALPEGAGTSRPASAPVLGGMARVDVADDGRCSVVWQNAVRSAALPKLSLPDGLIYTVERKLLSADASSGPLDSYLYTALDPLSGQIVAQHELPGATDTMQLAGTLAPGGILYQGMLTGVLRISARH